ncbi:MAG TPA: ComEC/Rec2 family competence protein, partial [Candidatus Acidoferrum sp.]|nr:ComEC/Rec2 family competence protein [Candidatus Acidoferrum sp.]
MARAPLLVPALAFVGAIICDAHGYVVVALGGAVVAALLPRGRVLAAFLIAGACCGALRGHPPLIRSESRVAMIAGTVIGDGGGASFTFALDDGRIVRASVGSMVVPGERLLVRARLVPFDEPRNPGEPSARAIGAAEGLAGKAIGVVVARRPADPLDARTWAARLRGALSARLRAVLREPEATVVAGALWGERGTLPATLRDDFQATGTVHVLVTAGLHLGVIAALVLSLLRLAGVPRVAASLTAIVCIVSYAWLTGAHLPAQRAAVMIGVALLARACGARIASWNALALAALVVAALWPAAATSVSFALSFSCVAAIVLFARPLEHALERLPVPARVREALSLTVATQIGVWPLTAATFGMVAPYAVLANALVVPATAVAMLGGVATLLVAAVPVLANACSAVTAFDVDVALGVVQFVASLPGARLSVAPPPPVAIVAYDLVALAAAALLSRAPRLACVLLALASASVMTTTLRLPDGHLTITMLDVGQGDAIVLRTPRGHTILIDSGGRLEQGPDVGGRSPAEVVGERIVLGYLRREGIHT